MRCLKAFGERIAVRVPDCQSTEFQLLSARINRSSALGIANIMRVA